MSRFDDPRPFAGMPSACRQVRLIHWILALSALLASPLVRAAGGDWPMFGQNPRNTASQTDEQAITVNNVSQLSVKWTFTTAGDVSARAAVVDGTVYFPDWGGFLNAVKASNGTPVWKINLASYGLTGSTTGAYHSRTTPAVVRDTLYLGTQEGAWLLAINAKSGKLLWKTQLESSANDPYAMITTSPTVVGGVVYTGTASNQEGVAGSDPSYPCCTARGSVVAVHALTGKVKWKTYTVPTGYSGGAIWGSNPVVADMVYIGTGNNYSIANDDAVSAVPGQTYGQCITAGGTAATCNSPDDHEDSILALDIATGAIRWSTKLVNWNQSYATNGSDNWNVACFTPPFTNCPASPGPDYDFGSAPNLITYMTASGPKTIIGAGQKSGIYYALDPKSGAVLWQTQVGPGSSLGGSEWGSATDGKRIYVQTANFYGMPTALGTTGGMWSALDPATGSILWQTADPNGAIDIGPVTVSNGVVYAASMSGSTPSDPTMVAMDATTGKMLWTHAAGSSVNDGATVVDGTVYWGSGYAHLGIPGYTTNNVFYAFSLNGN